MKLIAKKIYDDLISHYKGFTLSEVPGILQIPDDPPTNNDNQKDKYRVKAK